MAFNQASFFLFPPRYGPVVEYDHTARTASGKPLELISTNIVDSSAQAVLVADLRRWLVDRGFTGRERYGGLQVLFRDRAATPFGTQEVIKLALPLDEDEIQELYIRFLLTERAPDQIPAWRELILELGHDFGFRIMDEGHRLLPCMDFTTVLTENQNFCNFQNNYGWRI